MVIPTTICFSNVETMNLSKIVTDHTPHTNIQTPRQKKTPTHFKLTLMAMQKEINSGIQITFVKTIDGERWIFVQSSSEATHSIVDSNLDVFRISFIKRSAKKFRFKGQKFVNKKFKNRAGFKKTWPPYPGSNAEPRLSIPETRMVEKRKSGTSFAEFCENLKDGFRPSLIRQPGKS